MAHTFPRPRRPNDGFSLVEVMIALSVLSIAAGALVTELLTVHSLDAIQAERQTALDAVISQVEALHAVDPEVAFVRFNATQADDPVGVACPGNGFAVPGLTAQEGDADGWAGSIVFPGDAIQLREDAVDDALGTPRDLNLDGAVDGADHAADYEVLPVRVRVDWTGRGGDQSLEVVTTLVVLGA